MGHARSPKISDQLVETFDIEIEAIARIGAAQKILQTVCQTTGVGFAAIARVTPTRWVALAVRDEINFGLTPGGELEIQSTICHEIRCNREHVAIDHVEADPRWRDHHTPKRYGFQSYLSVPIILKDDSFFGTLCAIHPTPLNLSATKTIESFKLFAELISMHIDAQRRSRQHEAALLNERETAQFREQFIAVLGHDLRGPLSAIASGAELLKRMPLTDQAVPVVGLIRRSASRMSNLIRDVLDFARARLGDGIILKLAVDPNLHATLEQVVAEMLATNPHRAITHTFDLSVPIPCDSNRIAQLLSNLLGNAITHGEASGPVRVLARCDEDRFELSVTNVGPPLPPQVKETLFKPFVRGAHPTGGEGLGLGLYIVSEIAKAHRGTIDAISENGETTFTFRMPLRRDAHSDTNG